MAYKGTAAKSATGTIASSALAPKACNATPASVISLNVKGVFAATLLKVSNA